MVKEIELAKSKRLEDKTSDFIAARFGKNMVVPFRTAHVMEEQREIETVYDVVNAATAYAKGLKHQDARVAIEQMAGKLLVAA